MRLAFVLPLLGPLILAAPGLGAQQPAPPPPAEPVNTPAQAPSTEGTGGPKVDPAAVERGRQLLVQQCGFCHGSNARGGQQGPDLIRSDLVQSDENGKQLGAFLKVGRPERRMPRFDLPDRDVADLATFLHETIRSVSDRDQYKILDIVVGDAKAGERFFNGAGKCSSCHSPEGDLKGIGAAIDPVTLQGRLVMPRGRRRGPGVGEGGPSGPPFLDPTAIQATVTTGPGESVKGPLIFLTDFHVTLYDPQSKGVRSWLRKDGVPAVTVEDPLQAHVDMLRRWTDTDIHNLTAYLAKLK